MTLSGSRALGERLLDYAAEADLRNVEAPASKLSSFHLVPSLAGSGPVAVVPFLLFCRPFGRWNGLESLVRNRLAALD